MLSPQEKISFRQAVILFITLLYSPAIRFFPSQAAAEAKQAGWLTPLVSFVFLLLLVLVFHGFYKKHKDASWMDIICKITGKYLGSVILSAYIGWLVILLVLYTKYYAIRINTAIAPVSDISFFIIVMLVLAAVVLRHGLVVFARMGEIIALLLLIGFALLFVFSTKNISIDNLTPISRLDILPVIKGSYYLTGLWAYFVVLFFFSDKIKDKEAIKNAGIKGALFLAVMHIVLAVMTIGSLGYSVTARSNLPFYMTVKNITILRALDRIEALSVTQWIIADFILIIVFFYSILCIIKYLFKLSDTKSLVGILTILMYILSLYIAKSQFELQEFSVMVAIHLNTLFGFIIPVLLFIAGKILKKI